MWTKIFAVLFGLVAVLSGLLATRSTRIRIFHDALPFVSPYFIGIWPDTLTDEERAVAFKYTDLPDLTGHVAVVTGANAGVGYWTAYHLAKKGSSTVLACRNQKKCEEAVAKMKQSLPAADIRSMILDTSSLRSVETFSQAFRKQFVRLDHLVMNAGINYVPENTPLSVDKIDLMFATNHLGHFKLFQDLSEILESTASNHGVSTLTVVASSAHFFAKDMPSLSVDAIQTAQTAFSYPQSKVCNILFANEVAARMKAKGVNVLANSNNPGFVTTSVFEARIHDDQAHSALLGSLRHGFITTLQEALAWTTEDGALTQVFAAAASAITDNKITGTYFQPIGKKVEPNQALVTKDNQVKLWKLSEELVHKLMQQIP